MSVAHSPSLSFSLPLLLLLDSTQMYLYMSCVVFFFSDTDDCIVTHPIHKFQVKEQFY